MLNLELGVLDHLLRVGDLALEASDQVLLLGLLVDFTLDLVQVLDQLFLFEPLGGHFVE